MKPGLGVSVVLLCACTSPQEIVLSIDTTAGIPCEIDHIRVTTTTSAASQTFERDVSNARLPIVLKLQDETSRGDFDLKVSAFKDNVEVLQSQGPLSFGSADLQSANVVLESTCTPNAPCKLPDLIPGSVPAVPVSARVNCGATVRRYIKSPVVTEMFRDACTAASGVNSGTVLAGKHGAEKIGLSAEALASFGFRFYGTPIRQIWAHEDGYISFELNNPDMDNNRDPGSFDRDLLHIGVPPPPQSAMIFWDQLNLNPMGVCYALEGATGAQKLRVTWSQACQIQPCGTDSLNFTIVLDERTQRVSFTYGDMIASNTQQAQGGSATVGIVNVPNTCVATECNSSTGQCNDGRPCGYNQLFSKMVQPNGLQDVTFEPVTESQ